MSKKVEVIVIDDDDEVQFVEERPNNPPRVCQEPEKTAASVASTSSAGCAQEPETVSDSVASPAPGHESDDMEMDDSDVAYDDDEALEVEDDPYAEVEEHILGLADGTEKVRLQKLLKTLRGLEERIHDLENAELDLSDEAALVDNDKNLTTWRKWAEATLDAILQLMDQGQENTAPGPQMKPFKYRHSGDDELDRALSRLVNTTLEDEAKFREELRAGHEPGPVPVAYREEVVEHVMQEIANKRNLQRLIHKATHAPLSVASVFPAFHAAVKKYRGKQFHRMVLPKFTYDFNEPELPQDAGLEQALEASGGTTDALLQFAEEFVNAQRAQGRLVELQAGQEDPSAVDL